MRLTAAEKAAVREVFGDGVPSPRDVFRAAFAGPIEAAAFNHMADRFSDRASSCCVDEQVRDRTRHLLELGLRWCWLRGMEL